ncbi:HET domain-containing protein [Colletotrichum paranaense]|uniref:HET domain-containing protein n=1 Tax=Colletotrichum paranaense TaxID=1914294 RepID=A0ABQ9SZB8_9PEZI|nr:HET domain-containing protein [Colletotrichum paranaense]KAK1544871.1 HET domain-containing protein [Colletotrichum paranaense]
MDLFQYEPLDLTGKSFRLLMLHPGSTGEISCDIFEASLDSDGIIPYEALSYAWGSIGLSASIIANGKTLRITNNLFTALSHVRDDSIGRVMWIDAVCIDQANIAERGHQVGQMAGIYRGAEQVIIWLGPSTFETKLLMGHLKELQRSFVRHKRHEDDLAWAKQKWSTIRQGSEQDQAVLVDLQRNALLSLLSQTWFTRIWILQEVSNARVAIVQCGNQFVQAHMLNIASKLVGVTPEAGCQAVLDLFPTSSTQRSPRMDVLPTLLQKFRKSKASDPRDMVYALVAIASDVPEGDSDGILTPDYFKTEKQLVEELRKYLFLDLQYGRHIFEYTMVLFLEALPQETGGILRSFVVDGLTEHVRTLLDRGQRFTVDGETVVRLMTGKGGHGVKLLSDLIGLEHQNLRFDTQGMATALGVCDYATAEKVINLHQGDIQVDRHFVEAFFKREQTRSNVTKLFVERKRHSIEVTQTGFESLLDNCHSVAIIKLFLEHQKQIYRITDFTLQLAAYERVFNRGPSRSDTFTRIIEIAGDHTVQTKFDLDALLRLIRCHDTGKMALLLESHFKKVRAFACGGSPERIVWSLDIMPDSDSSQIRKEIEDMKNNMIRSTESEPTMTRIIRVETESSNDRCKKISIIQAQDKKAVGRLEYPRGHPVKDRGADMIRHSCQVSA